MIVETVKLCTDWILDNTVRTRIYKTMIDDRGRVYTDYSQYLYVPYSERGQEIKTEEKGRNIDVRA